MDKQRIILESSPAFVLVCIIVGLGYAFLLYSRKKNPWSTGLNWGLFALRAIAAFLISFLLLGPIIRQIHNVIEKPLFVVLQDNSGSVKEATDSATLQTVLQKTEALQEDLVSKGYEVTTMNLEGNPIPAAGEVTYSAASSDLQGALRKVANRYEGRKFGGVLLVSDGIYNVGLSPLYSDYRFPVYTLGVGDTAQRIDVAIKNVAYNKIAYQGNRFPIRVEVLLKGLTQQALTISLSHKGRVIETQTLQTQNESLVTADFQVQAADQGIQRYDVQVNVLPGEANLQNNHATIFVEVVEGKKKILVIAAAPHPDIKALNAVVSNNSNYELLIDIPGLLTPNPTVQPGDVDLVIFHQAPDQRGKTRALFQEYMRSKTSVFMILGRQTDYAFLSRQKQLPLQIQSLPRDFDEVTPVINPGFSNFVLEPEVNTTFAAYPPVSIPFAKIQVPLQATVPLWQRIGSITTDKPLLAIQEEERRKIGVLLGEGIWRWRLDEFDRTESADAFDEFFGKLIQFLSTTDEKKRFRSYPVEQEFSESEPVVFESQVYNDIFEPVFGNTINLELTDEAGGKTSYTYVTSPGNIRYEIGGLHQGVYRYRAYTELEGKRETVAGQFAVLAQMAEIQNLTADFELLRKLSTSTGGEFFPASRIDQLQSALTVKEASGVIRSDETFNSLINLKWIFWVLLTMVSVEWFLRKYFGGY